jgi:hypothetical protein
MTIAQDRVPPKKSIRYAEQAFGDGVHQTIRYQRDPKEWSDGHATIHFEMLTDPRGKQAAQRKTGDRYALAQLARDRDVLIDRSVKIFGA